MSKKQILSLVSILVVTAASVATALGHGPVAEEIRASICGTAA